MSKNDYEKALSLSAVIAFVPDGRSMWPFLKAKRQSVIVTRKKQRLMLYQVAMYKRDNGDFGLHRVVGVTEDGYVMQGDSQFFTETVKEEAVFGVLQGFYRGKKYIDANAPDYLEKVKRWHDGKAWRKFRVGLYNLRNKVKDKTKRIFRGKKEKNDDVLN